MIMNDEVDVDDVIEVQQQQRRASANRVRANAGATAMKALGGEEVEEEEDEIHVVLLPESASMEYHDNEQVGAESEIRRLTSTIKTLESTIGVMESEIQLLRTSVVVGADKKDWHDDPTGDGGGDALTKLLPQDTFSFLLTSPSTSITFGLALLVYVFQMVTFALVMIDVVHHGSAGNPFGIPGGVTLPVRASQFVAIVIAVFTQSDLMTGVASCSDGFAPKDMGALFPESTQCKYLLSILARLTEGALSLTVSFALIVSAEDVKGLLLNFTAIEFVSNLDEVVFFLCAQGFLGKSNKLHATEVQETFYQKDQKHSRVIKMVLLLTILLVMMTGLSVVIYFQQTGQYLCGTLQVQFGDDFVPTIGLFSGLYDLETPPYDPFSTQQRVMYVERRAMEIQQQQQPNEENDGSMPPSPSDAVAAARFAYCEEFSAWTFYHHWSAAEMNDSDTTTTTTTTGDPCRDWVAKSATTDTFELAETGTMDWIVRNFHGREVQLEPFHLQCFDCSSDDGGDSDEENCGGHGICVKRGPSAALVETNICRCDKHSGFFGLRCEFDSPCQRITVDSSQTSEGFVSTREWADTYELFVWEDVPVEAYHRPVYIHSYELKEKGNLGWHDLILFLGRRWGLTSSSDLLPTMGKQVSREMLADYFRTQFHAHSAMRDSNLRFSFLSEPADLGTPKDASSPVGLNWYRTNRNAGISRLQPVKPIDAVLLCSICNDETNPCSFDGQCSNGTCHCSPGSSGALCQIPPTGNGYCNPYFNTPEYTYDKGDCCDSTCHSSSKYQCGYDEQGATYMGYPNCIQHPPKVWYAHGGGLHSLPDEDDDNNNLIQGEPFAFSGSIVALARNGGSLAIAEPGSVRIRLFDKDGADWNERIVQPDLQGQPWEISTITASNNFNTTTTTTTTIKATMEIQSLAISSGPIPLLNAPGVLAPLLIAVSGKAKDIPNLKDSVAYIFYCTVESCINYQTIPSARTVTVSSDGSVVAAVVQKDGEPWIRIYDWKSSDHDGSNGMSLHEREVISWDQLATAFDIKIPDDTTTTPPRSQNSNSNNTIANYYLIMDQSPIYIRGMHFSHDGAILAVEISTVSTITDSNHDAAGPPPSTFNILQKVVTLHWDEVASSYLITGGGKSKTIHERTIQMGGSGSITSFLMETRPSFALSRNGTLAVVAVSKCSYQAFALERKTKEAASTFTNVNHNHNHINPNKTTTPSSSPSSDLSWLTGSLRTTPGHQTTTTWGSWKPSGEPMSSVATQKSCVEPTTTTEEDTSDTDSYGENYVGESLAITASGMIVIGNDFSDVATFEWNGSSWIQQGGGGGGAAHMSSSLESGPGVSIAVDGTSSDSMVVMAVGLPQSQPNNAGGTFLYSRISSALPSSTTIDDDDDEDNHDSADLLRIFVTPDTLDTSWTLETTTNHNPSTATSATETNASRILWEQGGNAWALASFTDEIMVEQTANNDDCVGYFTVYWYSLTCRDVKRGKCKPPNSLPDPRFRLTMDHNGWDAMGRMKRDSSVTATSHQPAAAAGDCGHPRFAPQRVAIGKGCFTCPTATTNSQSLVEVMIYACVPTTWELRKNSDGSILLGEEVSPYHCDEDTDGKKRETSSMRPGCLYWYRGCMDIDSCYTFTIRSVEEETRRRLQRPPVTATTAISPHQSRLLIPIDFYVYVNGRVVLSGMESTETQLGQCE